MSDNIEDIKKVYKKDVLTKEHSKSIASPQVNFKVFLATLQYLPLPALLTLFQGLRSLITYLFHLLCSSVYPRLVPIPEYFKLEQRGMWSEALNALLTTLRYLAPATLLTLFWGQQSFLFKLLSYIDSAFRSLVFSSEEQKKSSLQWLEEAGSVRVESLDTVWRNGWILCGILDTALPGACEGHPPTRQSLGHAQTIAEHYLGVEPVFTRHDFESIESLSKNQEWKLTIYLDRIRDALSKLTPPVSKPNFQRTSPETAQFTLDYVAKGTGLVAAQINNKMHFKIYPTSQQSLDPGEVTILIRGPRDTYGMTVVPPILGKAHLIRQKLLGLETKPSYTENALPITQGAVYLRSYGKNNMNKTYYIPKAKCDIQIEVDLQQEYARIGYKVRLEGNYEITITTRGQNIIGSPFTMKASRNIIGILEKENSCLEDGEEIDVVDVKTHRKVVLKIVDFGTEKMLLRENGTLEKLTDDQARGLMKSNEIKSSEKKSDLDCKNITKQKRFNKVVRTIITMNKFCKILNQIIKDKRINKKIAEIQIRSNSPQTIPDIVNSTLNEPINEKDNLALSKTNKSYFMSSSSKNAEVLREQDILNAITETEEISLTDDSLISDSLNQFKMKIDNDNTDDSYSEGGRSSTSNPFLNDVCQQSYEQEKDFGALVNTEYDTNNLQNELTQGPSIQVFDAEESTPPPFNNNPFIDPDVLAMERPKTPVLKIITGEFKEHRGDSVFIDPNTEKITENLVENEFLNPFFLHKYHQSTNENEINEMQPDFIIGAPVSLPPLYRATSPEPYSLIKNQKHQDKADCIQSPVYSTPDQNCSTNDKKNTSQSLNATGDFHSLDATDKSELVDNISHAKELPENLILNKRDTWDSAYVSIDDTSNSSSPENDPILLSNNNKQKIPLTEVKPDVDFSKVGPNEKEIWETCEEINSNTVNKSDDKLKWDSRRQLFTPIIEEIEKTTSTSKQEIIDSVTVAFAELNNLYNEYYPNLDDNTKYVNKIYNKNQHKDMTIENKESNTSVDSASELLPDVKRRAKQLEGLISEVQSNVTESVSVSHTLQDIKNATIKSTSIKQFGDDSFKNIVLEKKKYWDQRIREIEVKAAETKRLERKTRSSAKNRKHNDSLSKKRGNKIVNNFLGAALAQENLKVQTNNEILEKENKETDNKLSDTSSSIEDIPPSDLKLVEKWKKYWDEKLEVDKEEQNISCIGTKSPKPIAHFSQQPRCSYSSSSVNSESDVEQHQVKSPPMKQEVSEEVFKAFETSPKRFFGRSRQQIISKIDAFLEKTSVIGDSKREPIGTLQENSIVSRRISLFHCMSQTHKIPHSQKRSQSMHNVSIQSDYFRESHSPLKATMIKSHSLNDDNQLKTKPYIDEKINSYTHKETDVLKFSKSYNKPTYGSCQRKSTLPDDMPELNIKVKETVQNFNKNTIHDPPMPNSVLHKTSVSKSEMDIFNKTSYRPVCDSLEKIQSCEDLPTINVKSFILLYESVSKPSSPILITKKFPSTHSKSSSTSDRIFKTSTSDAVNMSACFSTPAASIENLSTNTTPEKPKPPPRSKRSNTSLEKDIVKMNVYSSSTDSLDFDAKRNGRTTTLVSLSDIELEIVEDPTDVCPLRESSPLDFKSRFKTAREYFKSLEELGDSKTEQKLNECEMLLFKSEESLEVRPNKHIKKNFKAHSVPSSELSKIWNQLLDEKDGGKKLVKISEKFNVDDLFADVVEGKLSRQGSLRGIPHKKAVLETFRSMENVSDSAMSPYEISIKQLKNFAEENKIKNVQTYLTEYPFLPKTEPSKYRSRLDTNASGLISLRELKQTKPRRNSVPDLRINPNFIVDL